MNVYVDGMRFEARLSADTERAFLVRPMCAQYMALGKRVSTPCVYGKIIAIGSSRDGEDVEVWVSG